MKKLLFLLLLSVSGYSQAVFDEGIQITGGQTTTSTTSKILSQESDGIVNTIDAVNLPISTATENALFAKKDATSTAVTSTATLTNNGTTFTLSPLTGVIVDNSTVPSTRTVINFAGASNVTPLYFRTLLYIDNTGTLQQMNGMTTDLTPQQRVDNLFIGIVVYSGGTVQVVQLIPDIEYSIDNRFSVLTDFIRNINEGNNIGANGANLQVNKGAGYTFRRGSNFSTNREVPDVTTDAAATPIPASPNLIGYRNGSGGWTYEAYTGSLTPQFWDNGTGVKATVANNKFTNQRVYFFNGTNTYVIYLGRTEHATLETAATAAQSPDAIVDPATSVGSLIGTISVAHNATALNNTAQARFTQGPRMQGGTGAGGASGSQNLQNTYLNSSVPQITTTALGAVTVQEGTGNDANNVLVGKNNAGVTTFSVAGAGNITGGTYNGYTPANAVNSPFTRTTAPGLISDFDYYLGNSPELSRSSRIYVNKPSLLGVDSSSHTFADYSPITQSSGGTGLSAYASFDSKAIMSGTDPYNHFISFQGRNEYTGSGSLGTFTSGEFLINHSGSGTVNNAYGLRVQPKQGAGTITNYYGLRIESSTSGITNNFGIVTGSGKNIFGDNVHIGGSIVPETTLHVTKLNTGGQGGNIYLDNPVPSTLGNSTDILFSTWSGETAAIPGAKISVVNTNAGSGANDMVFYTKTTGGVMTEKMRITSQFATAPTAPVGTNTTQIATTAFVQAASGNLQNVYNNSTSPQITTTTALGAVTIQRGSAADTDVVFRTRNGAGTSTSTITGEGKITGTEITSSNNLTATNIFVNNRVQMAANTYLAYQGSTTGNIFKSTSTGWESGIKIDYQSDLSGTYTNRSLVDKAYSDKNRLIPYTFATLPASPSQGDSYSITDALAPAYLAPAAGGGTVFCPVVWNGTTWVCH